jgi:hypothetical protein
MNVIVPQDTRILVTRPIPFMRLQFPAVGPVSSWTGTLDTKNIEGSTTGSGTSQDGWSSRGELEYKRRHCGCSGSTSLVRRGGTSSHVKAKEQEQE